MEIVVFGAGSLGSLIGGLLSRVHDVTLVGRNPHVFRVREEGLRITGAVDEHAFPDATADDRTLSADLAIVAVKAFDTASAADALSGGDVGCVLSLQNGLTEETLAARLDGPVLAGTVTHGARLIEPGHVECTGVGRVVLGTLDGGADPLAERVGKAFRDAGVETLVATDMPRRRWAKLAVNAGINPVTTLARVENGALAGGPAADLARQATRETARVARAEGVGLTNRRALAALEEVIETTATNRSSMLQDVEAGRRTEIDAIGGEVVSRAIEHAIDVPTNRALVDLVHAWEANRALR